MEDELRGMPPTNRQIYRLIQRTCDGNVSAFAKTIKASQQRVNRLFSKDPRSGKYPSVSNSLMEAICETYNISEMELRNASIIDYNSRLDEDSSDKYIVSDSVINYSNGKPYYDVPFELGYNLPFNEYIGNPTYLVNFKPFNNCDFWCNASGYSMYPTIASGDFVAMKIMKDFRLIVNNEIYGFVLKNGLRTIKRAKLKGDVFTLSPDNKDYDEQEVNIQDVLEVYRVVGTVKVF